MLVYKYRDGNDNNTLESNLSTLERDLYSINSNYYWAAKIDSLNDPCETLVNSDEFDQGLNFLNMFLEDIDQRNALRRVVEAGHKLLNVHKNYVGIYSLSKSYLDELLWAHYANSHLGFCIEYELDDLVSEKSTTDAKYLDVIYQDKPPNFSLSTINGKYEKMVKTIGGYKSRRWAYEKEIRIVSKFAGEIFYNHKALKGIYFGLRMTDKIKDKIFRALRNRKIRFYQIKQIENTYQFEKEEIQNPYSSEYDFLNEIPKFVTNIRKNKFEIVEKNYYRDFEKGRISILLDEKPNDEELKWISRELKDSLFSKSKMVHMFYKFKGQEINDIAYATTHFEEVKGIKININEFID